MNMMNRRKLLRAAGVCLALPGLETYASKGEGPPRRMVLTNVPLGFHPPNFFPEEAGPRYKPSLYMQDADAHLRNDYTIISGTSHPEVDGGHSAEASFLTAAPHPAARGFKNSISLDQLVGKRVGKDTRFSTLCVGWPKLSWSENGVAVPAEQAPEKVFQRLFLAGSANDIARQKQHLKDGRSILDLVHDEAKTTQRNVSKLDQEKLEQYLTAVREAEKRLIKSERWLDTPKPKVDEPAPKGASQVDLPDWLQQHFQVMRLALQTDSTRVIAFSTANHSNVIQLPGVTMGYHALTHHGKNPQMISQLEVIEKVVIQAWANFLLDLKGTPEGGGTLLDSTQVLMGSNLGNASGHITKDLPILLAGGGWKHGQHLHFEGRENYPLARLFVSMMQQMGLEEDQFASGKGTMAGLV